MELTVSQIKEKQKKLKEELLEKLNQFEKETGIHVHGEIHWDYTQDMYQHWLSLNFSNPFSRI
jgi:predicted acetyltransferase